MNTNSAISPLQTLFLWALLSHGGEALLSELQPKLSPTSKRRELLAAGLIEEEKVRTTRSTRRGKQTVTVTLIRLSDAGWAWAATHLDQPVSTRSTAAGPILHRWLSAVQALLHRQDISLAELWQPSIESAPPALHLDDGLTPLATDDLPARIRAAYAQLSGGATNVRVRLAALREALTDVERNTLDQALLTMDRHGELVLYPLDDPREITPADRGAAIDVLGRFLHIVYLEI